MPELDIQTMGVCITNIDWETRVPGSSGIYTVRFERVNPEARQVLYDYTCTCPHYQIRLAHLPGQYCKHCTKAKKEHCGWSELVDGGKVIKSSQGEYACPRCGGPASFERVGV